MRNFSKCIQAILLGCLLFLSHFTNAQKLSKDTLDGNPYYLSVIEGQHKGKAKNVYILKIFPKETKYRMLRALYCSDSSSAFNSYYTPKSCLDWDSFKESGDRITNVNEFGSRSYVNDADLPDSSKTVNKVCLNEFYAANNDSIQVDTIYVVNKKLAYNTIFHVSKCAYINNRKQGKEIMYYELWALKGDCIDNKERIRLEGSWDKGKKTGEWLYYDVNGELIKAETYIKGKMKKTKSF
jgi:hypothetical protein